RKYRDFCLLKKSVHHGVAGITGKARENKEKCPLQNKRQCPTTRENLENLDLSRFSRLIFVRGIIMVLLYSINTILI
ncbi:hypothetical protein M7775_03620, partial [Sporomusa sphaeroides DSM 2875]|uniref:hypothetical protein n=1 Tax=Sporomusa sphaeroides TaxID=47679 RepID=UPI00202EFE9B